MGVVLDMKQEEEEEREAGDRHVPEQLGGKHCTAFHLLSEFSQLVVASKTVKIQLEFAVTNVNLMNAIVFPRLKNHDRRD